MVRHPQAASGVVDVLHSSGVDLPQAGHDLQPEEVSGRGAGVGVGGVLHVGDVAGGGVGRQLFPCHVQQWMGGIKDMKKLPSALFVIDPRKEHNAILEARKLHIPIVATVDTNCDPDEVDYLMPANDDAIRAVRLLTSKMADAVLEGKASAVDEEAAAADEAAAEEEAKDAE